MYCIYIALYTCIVYLLLKVGLFVAVWSLGDDVVVKVARNLLSILG